LFLGQSQVYEESSQLLKRLTGVDLSGKQIEHLCHHYGQESETMDNETLEKSDELHYAMVDGSYILSREQGWMETKVGRVFKADQPLEVSEKRRVLRHSAYATT